MCGVQVVYLHDGVGPTEQIWHLQWRHYGRDDVSNHQPHDCLETKLRVTGLCAVNAPVTGEFFAQKASNAENVSIWWRHHVWLKAQFSMDIFLIRLSC